MREIASDLWNEDIWGAESPPLGVPRPKVVLWFGRDDHWVADQCRDDLIKVRGSHDSKEDWRPVMVIDDTGIPHGFCISEHRPLLLGKSDNMQIIVMLWPEERLTGFVEWFVETFDN